MKPNKILSTILIILIIIFLIFEIFPIYWVVSNSFKTYKDIRFYPPKFIFEPILQNYKDAVVKGDFLKSILQSAIISLVTVGLAVLMGTMASYGIVRLKFGGNGLLLFLISSRMLPIIVLVLPIYIIFSKLKLIDSYYSLIITYTTFSLSFVIWQMSSFLKEVPKDIEDAACIDGCNYWQIFFRIIIPISRPGLSAVSIFCFLGAWNEYLFASILAGSNIKTAPFMVSTFIVVRDIAWGPMAAACVMTLIPTFIFILLVQKHMVEGLTMGSIKG